MSKQVRAAVAVLLVVLATGWIGGGLPRVEVASEVDSLLPAGDPAVQALDTMASSFGGDPVVVLLEGGGDPLGPDRLPATFQLEGRLSNLPDVVATYGPATTLNQTVIRLKQMLAGLSGRRDAIEALGRKDALERFDQRYGTLLVHGLPGGLPTLDNPAFVRSVVVDRRTDRPKPQWRQYLPAEETVAIYVRPREGLDQETAERLTADVREAVEQSGAAPDGVQVTVTGVPVITSSLASQMRAELPRLAGSAFAVVALVLFLVPWTPRRRRRLAPMLVMATATGATLATFGWLGEPLSIGAATFLPIILGLGTYYPVYLADPTHRRLVLTVASAAAVAFGGLLLSPLPFVSDLGLAVPLGLALVVAISLLATVLRRPIRAAAVPERPSGHPGKDLAGAADGPGRRPAAALVSTVALAAVAAAGWVALADVELRTDPQQLLAGVPALEDALHVEDVLGYSGEVDVILEGEEVLSPAALAWATKAQELVVREYGDRVRPVVSLPSLLAFLGDDPTAKQVRAGAAAIPAYIRSAVLAPGEDRALLSFGVALDSLVEDHDLLGDVVAGLPEPPAGYEVQVSGFPVAVERGYDLVSASRYESNLVALLLAGLVLLVGLPRRRDAGLALLAAVLATGVGITLVASVGGNLNPLTLALGCLTAATGCEFTVLLAAARRQRDRQLARSVGLAAGLSVGGYAVLMTSSLPVLREFGLALTASVALALGCALVVSSWAARPPRQDATLPARSATDHAHDQATDRVVPEPVPGGSR